MLGRMKGVGGCVERIAEDREIIRKYSGHTMAISQYGRTFMDGVLAQYTRNKN